MARFAPATGIRRAGRSPHPSPHRVLLARRTSWTTMNSRWVDAVRDSAPPAAVAARV